MQVGIKVYLYYVFILYDYSINKLSSSHNNTIKGLGVIFDSNKHVNYIRKKSLLQLGLLNHMCIDFYDNTYTIKILYFSLIWQTDNICQNTTLSSIKNFKISIR